MSSAATLSGPEPSTSPLTARRRTRWIVGILLAVVLVVAAVVTVVVVTVVDDPDVISLRIADQNSAYSVAISPDNRTLALGIGNTPVELWDATTGTSRRTPLTGLDNVGGEVEFSPDGTIIAAGGVRTIMLWDPRTGDPIHRIPGHAEYAITDLAFSPDGRILASAGYDQTLRLWDVRTGAAIGTPLSGHGAIVGSVTFSPDGRTLYYTSGQGVVRYDTATRRQLGAPLQDSDGVTTLVFSPDGSVLVGGDNDGVLRRWDPVTGLLRGEPFDTKTEAVVALAFPAKGDVIAVAGYFKVGLWDIGTAEQVGDDITRTEGPEDEEEYHSMAISPDGRRIVASTSRSVVQIVSLED
ncbi:WD40 repeat domain-containing protein [Cryptosporangium aurantiacum]|uniref:WD domain-containing protein, G-beta repeat-containing protein n=1 Tax=Cryptosporangium aurantiacum TaxID=134849 RepID=A0A1M7RBQ7_9ACTN|nr:WD40 repeat domain-containing protein [Cryptosporangium aurantiacum]SHN43641.1 WD domain-containing protein, G-beta repeat-containing protein [Cryptosporangium aurantiacum]